MSEREIDTTRKGNEIVQVMLRASRQINAGRDPQITTQPVFAVYVGSRLSCGGPSVYERTDVGVGNRRLRSTQCVY